MTADQEEQAERIAAGMRDIAAAAAQSIERLQPFLQQFINTMVPLMEQHMEAILQWGRQVHALLWEAYRAAGMPYGETDDGIQRWMRELAQASQLEAEAQRIRQRQEMLADARALGEAIRQRSA